MPQFRDLLFLIFLYLIFFISYLELSPSLGNIWYRIGSDGFRHIQLLGIIEVIKKPLTSLFLWHPQFWDINFFIGSVICIIIWFII
jgi:hypothetical protein